MWTVACSPVGTVPAATHIRVPSYRRREPDKEPLYQILAEHLETFLQQARTSEHHLPFHVEKEMRAYLECGVLAYGFVRARCEECGKSRAVAFSCKKRGFCTSCTGRRMADTAARLVDDVLPRVPVRQFVLSFPYEIRYRLAWDGELVSAVLGVFLRVVGRWYRRQAQAAGFAKVRCGSVTFVQRFGSSLNVNPHVHVLMLDGVYIDGDEGPQFVPAPPLTDEMCNRSCRPARAGSSDCVGNAACSIAPRLTPSPTKSPCWPPSPRLPYAASSPLVSALASGCDECFGIRREGYAPDLCASPRAVSPCMQRPGSRPITGRGSSNCAVMSPGRRWRRGDCASSTPTNSPSR